MQSKRIQAWQSLNNDTSHLLPQRARMRACVLAFVRGRRACVSTNVLCMFISCACVRAVGVFSQACVRVDVSCTCLTVMCVLSRTCVALTSRVRARRVRVVMSVRARRVRVVMSVRARRCLVCAMCVLSRACVRVDVSCACVTVMCVLSRACIALTFRVRASYLSQEHERFGLLVHFRPLYR